MSDRSEKHPAVRWGQNLALAVGSLVFFFGLGEAGLRLAGFESDRGTNVRFSWVKRGEYWTMGPNIRWRTKVGGHPVATNSMGFRDREFGPPEPGVFRILVLGDSVTFGHGVPCNATFARRLEVLLSTRERRVDVLNAGVPGWSTRQERIFYERHGEELAPDLVLVGFVLNDFTEMHRGVIDLGLQRELALTRFLSWLSERSAVAAGFKRVYAEILKPASREIDAVSEMAQRSFAPEVQHAMQVTVDELAGLAGLVERRGARFGLVVLPFRSQLEYPRVSDAPQRRLERFAAEQGIPMLDLLPLFQRYRPKDVLLDHDHPTIFGHSLVAGSVANWLARESLLPASQSPLRATGGESSIFPGRNRLGVAEFAHR